VEKARELTHLQNHPVRLLPDCFPLGPPRRQSDGALEALPSL
jgi:hypothetical protein